MGAKDTVMSDKHWRWVQKQSGEDILGMVMDSANDRKTASELMDTITEHCLLSYKAGIREEQERMTKVLRELHKQGWTLSDVIEKEERCRVTRMRKSP